MVSGFDVEAIDCGAVFGLEGEMEICGRRSVGAHVQLADSEMIGGIGLDVVSGRQ